VSLRALVSFAAALWRLCRELQITCSTDVSVIYVILDGVFILVLTCAAISRFSMPIYYENSRMAEGVGLFPRSRKALKINGRFRRYVLQDYRTGVPLCKRAALRQCRELQARGEGVVLVSASALHAVWQSASVSV
jgi:hypothetical protein